MGCGASSARYGASGLLLGDEEARSPPPKLPKCACPHCDKTVVEEELGKHVKTCNGRLRSQQHKLQRQCSDEDIEKVVKVQAHARGMLARVRVTDETGCVHTKTRRLSGDCIPASGAEAPWVLMRQVSLSDAEKAQADQGRRSASMLRRATRRLGLLQWDHSNASAEDVRKVTKVQAQTRGVQARRRVANTHGFTHGAKKRLSDDGGSQSTRDSDSSRSSRRRHSPPGKKRHSPQARHSPRSQGSNASSRADIEEGCPWKEGFEAGWKEGQERAEWARNLVQHRAEWPRPERGQSGCHGYGTDLA